MAARTYPDKLADTLIQALKEEARAFLPFAFFAFHTIIKVAATPSKPKLSTTNGKLSTKLGAAECMVWTGKTTVKINMSLAALYPLC